jgi:hypothetical protein
VNRWLLSVLAVVLLAGCSVHQPSDPSPVTATRTPGIITAVGHGWDVNGLYGPTYPAGACHSTGGLSDPRCTPGAIDGAVTQATIGTTICKSGYTATVRPPLSLTGPAKRESAKEYGTTVPGEYDHLIPLELGGASDTRNLWLEPGALPNPKDKIENVLRQRVCSRAMTLADAQRRIATDWTKALP